MEVNSLKCKDCGAPLSIEEGATLARCNYCGSHFGIKHPDEEPEVVLLERVEKRRKINPLYEGLLPGFTGPLHIILVLMIVGFFLFCALLCGVASMPLFLSPEEMPTIRAASGNTRRLLDDVGKVCTRSANAKQMLPDPDYGSRLIFRYQDEWGRQLRYEQNSATEFAIRSAGVDGHFETSDDLHERFSASLEVDDEQRVATPPQDLAEALRYLATPGRFQKHAALVWLIAETPELTDEQRDQVVVAAIPLLQDRNKKEQAQRVLNRWADVADAEHFLQAAALAARNDEEYIDAIVLQLIRLEAKDSVLEFVNYPSRLVRASVAVAASDWNIPASAIIQQSVEDLATEATRVAALERLKAMQLNDEQPSQVAHAVKLLLLDAEGNGVARSTTAGVLALDILEQENEVTVPLLLKVYETAISMSDPNEPLRDRAGQLLVAHLEPQVCRYLVEQLANDDDETAYHATRLLKEIGPAAESHVWPTLANNNMLALPRVYEVLAAIGTEQSVPYLEQSVTYLEQIAEDHPLVIQAKAVVIEIRAANRQAAE